MNALLAYPLPAVRFAKGHGTQNDFVVLPDIAGMALAVPAVRKVVRLRAVDSLQRRIGLFLALPLESIDELGLQSKLREIGKTADAKQDAD